jgi:hypothetical protein
MLHPRNACAATRESAPLLRNVIADKVKQKPIETNANDPSPL